MNLSYRKQNVNSVLSVVVVSTNPLSLTILLTILFDTSQFTTTIFNTIGFDLESDFQTTLDNVT